MKPIFCGNFDYDARESDLERLFRRYGKVDKVDMKPGFAFVYMDDERDAEDAIRALDRTEYGRKGRRLRVEWTRQERTTNRRPPASSRRSSANTRPSKTLFVINFDPYNTRIKDLERHFDPYGKILNVRIRRNFAFVQYELQEDATRALDATNMSKLMGREISVEYAAKDDDNRRNGHSPDRIRDRSPMRRGYSKGRSPSPYGRERGSPDYGHGGHGRSASPYRRERASPDYGGGTSPSPKRRERSPDYGRGPSPSPKRKERSPEYGEVSPSPKRKERNSNYGHGPSPSPNGKERNSEDGRGPSPRPGPSPRRGRPSHDNDRGPNPIERVSPAYGRGLSPSPQRERLSPDDYHRSTSIDSKAELRDSPRNGGESPTHEQYQSGSPLARQERSGSD